MTRSFTLVLTLALLSGSAEGCGIDTAPDGARATPPGGGPTVVYDTTRRPLPEIPQPNDIATFADPTSRTGRRINTSSVSSTRLESVARAGFNTLEGWGTFAPITVAFANTTTDQPAVDLDDVARRTADYDPADDPFYVVDLTTGLPAILDMGKGSFPVALVDSKRYWPNDPRADQDSLLFETVEEGAGLPRGAYRADLDTDFDGVLDHPNVLHPNGQNARVEDVISWYERETDTLILRPVVPFEEKHEYAVVLTDRLKGPDGQPVKSPFPAVHHPQQRSGAERVRSIFSDPQNRARAYYGDLAGTGLDHVAFVWTFTTQPVYEDMRLLRDGLHGHGPFSRLATEFPPVATAARAMGLTLDAADETPGAIAANPACAPRQGKPYIVDFDSARTQLSLLLQQAIGLSGPELARLMKSLESVDHFVIGSYESPYFLGDPKHEDPDGKFELDFKSGHGRVARDTVQFWISVPKARPDRKQPFPTAVWAHGTTLHADEIIIRAGYFAEQGLAMMGINMPGHGLYLNPGLQAVAEAFLGQACLAPWAKAIGTGRQQDLNGDGEPDSGGLLWSAHIFHSRDNIRQGVVDEMQATRVLRGFDGQQRSTQDYDGDGHPDLAGDFDGDGVPDLGGPDVPITTSGNSFGGILAMVHGAVDPNVAATAPISGGGGLSDIATRSALIADSVIEQGLSPLVVAVPAETLAGVEPTRCADGQRSVRFVINDLTRSRQVEIACLGPSELDRGKTVVLANARNGEKRCARTGEAGRFRVPIPADVGDRLDLQIYDAPDAVVSYKGCELVPGAPAGRRIQSFEQAAVQTTPVGDMTKTCEGAILAAASPRPDGGSQGCAQFRDQFYPLGSPLVAPQEGLGLTRQSPELRRLFTLVQAAVDAGDPVNFARYYGMRAAPAVDGMPLPPRGIVAWNTVGDPLVPTGSGYTFARAAGAVPFLPPSFAASHPEWADYATPRALWDALGGKTPNQVLIDSGTLEGVARLGRTRAGATCKPNYVPSATCTMPPDASACATALADADWLAEGANLWDVAHPEVPLRLARKVSVRATGADSLDDAWAPRLAGGPFAADAAGWRPSVPLVGVFDAFVVPGGQHVFVHGDSCKAFDDVVYHDNLLVRYLATQGKDLYDLSHPSTHRCLERETCPGLY